MSDVTTIPEKKLRATRSRYPKGRVCVGPCERTLPPEVFWHGGRFRGNCPDCYRKDAARRSMEAYTRDPEKIIRRVKVKRYGLTDEQYDDLMAVTTCDICGDEADLMQIDHNHDTGEVRGRLCAPCNRGLGQFRDDLETLRRAVAYLEERNDV